MDTARKGGRLGPDIWDRRRGREKVAWGQLTKERVPIQVLGVCALCSGKQMEP